MPASARAQVLFRGFSFVAPSIEGEEGEGGKKEEKKEEEDGRDYSGTALLTNRVSGEELKIIP